MSQDPPEAPAPWLHVVGVGEDGMDGLSAAARALVGAAEVIVAGARHHRLAPDAAAERVTWPSPFSALVERIRSLEGRRVVVLATGDPLWHSVGVVLGRSFGPPDIAFHPHPSAFQLAAARLHWDMAGVETLTVHGRPPELVAGFIQPGARLLILSTGAGTPGAIARMLAQRGFGDSRMTVLAAMGGADETRLDGVAADWDREAPAFNTLAVECVAGADAALAPRTPGLADDLFEHDGTMTKREVRAATLAKLMPMRGALLWDVGAGCGSVSVEWMRAARGARAIAVEPRADRRAMAAANALALGAPGLELIDGSAPAALADLERPDAAFIGGGLDRETFATAWEALRPPGRLVCNAVTLESEALLLDLHAAHGGELARLGVSRAEPVGGRTGWRPFMPVTQWSLVKR